MDPIMEAIRDLSLPVPCLERLRQSVAEALRNAMQHRGGPGHKIRFGSVCWFRKFSRSSRNRLEAGGAF